MEKGLAYSLPLTTSTGKARVKRRKDNFGEPVSISGENKIQKEDYIEWQISYFISLDTMWDAFRKSKTQGDKIAFFEENFAFFKPKKLIMDIKNYIQNTSSPKKKDFKTKLKEIFEENGEKIISKPHKDDREFVMSELADLFRLGLKEGIITKKELQDLEKFIDNNKIDIEAQYKVTRANLNKTIGEGFEVFEEKYPLFIKKVGDKSFVEIQLKHKQRAVGFQSMIYFCLNLSCMDDDSEKCVVGRSAGSNEIVRFEITKEEIFWIAKSFIMASADHSEDIKLILQEILG
jgi:hypothetical protein